MGDSHDKNFGRVSRVLSLSIILGLWFLAMPTLAVAQPHDVVFLSPGRPMVLRLHVEVAGRPHGQVVEAWVKELFGFLDRNKDGILDAAEAERTPRPQDLAQRLRQGVTFLYRYPTTPLTEIDANDDDKVTLAELTQFYKGSDLALPRLAAPTTGYAPEAMTEALFNLCDANRDGTLTPEEMARVGEILARADLDDDETLAAHEVFPKAQLTPKPGEETAMMTRPGTGPGPRSFFLPHGRLGLDRQMIARYDVDNNGQLTLAEAGLERAVFEKLDANGDGILDGPELLKIVGQAPDLELLVRVAGPAGRPRVEVLSPTTATNGFTTKVVGGGLMLTLGAARLDLRAQEAMPGSVDPGLQLTQFAANLYPGDPTQRGFVTRADLTRPDARMLQPLFDVGDINGDGKMAATELLTLFQMDIKASSSVVTLWAGEVGRGLFELIDANRDGRLSVRELKTATERVTGDKAGVIRKAELPGQFALAISVGGQEAFDRKPLLGAGINPTAAPPSTPGPTWFRKMDRNGDGDVSRREWLGTTEDFQRFDTDGDGVLNPDEAARVR